MRNFIIVICWLGLVLPVHAEDWERVFGFCLDKRLSEADTGWCVIGERSMADYAATLMAMARAPKTKKRLQACLDKSPKSFTGAKPCIDKVVDSAPQDPPLPFVTKEVGAIPYYNMEALCDQVSANVGGSHQVREACIDQENKAKQLMFNRPPTVEITRFCSEVAKNVGGSYQAFNTCAEQEVAAMARGN